MVIGKKLVAVPISDSHLQGIKATKNEYDETPNVALYAGAILQVPDHLGTFDPEPPDRCFYVGRKRAAIAMLANCVGKR